MCSTSRQSRRGWTTRTSSCSALWTVCRHIYIALNPELRSAMALRQQTLGCSWWTWAPAKAAGASSVGTSQAASNSLSMLLNSSSAKPATWEGSHIMFMK